MRHTVFKVRHTVFKARHTVFKLQSSPLCAVNMAKSEAVAGLSVSGQAHESEHASKLSPLFVLEWWTSCGGVVGAGGAVAAGAAVIAHATVPPSLPEE